MDTQHFLTKDDLVYQARTLSYPQYLELPGADVLELTQALRVIPGKRLTARGIWQKKDVIAKIFFKHKKAALYAERDQSGIEFLVQAGIRTPTVYYAGETELTSVSILLFEYIAQALDFNSLWEEAKTKLRQLRLLVKIIATIAKIHDAGLIQEDMHAANFMIKAGRVYSLDGDGIQKITHRKKGLRAKEGLSNLAMMIAHLAFVHEINYMQAFRAYCQFRKIETSPRLFNYFTKAIAEQSVNIRRKVLQKTLRECTNFATQKGLRLRAIWARKQSETTLPALLPSLEHKLQDRPPANKIAQTKKHESITLPLDERTLLIKRYANSALFTGFCRVLGCSTAKKAWVNSHYLSLLRVPAIRQIAFCEKGFFPWFDKSYLISDAIEGQPLDQFLTENEQKNEKIELAFNQIAAILSRLAKENITYGHMDSSHFLVTEEGVLLSNFDQLKQHKSAKKFKRKFKKEIYQFIHNWKDKPQFAGAAAQALKRYHLIDLALEQN